MEHHWGFQELLDSLVVKIRIQEGQLQKLRLTQAVMGHIICYNNMLTQLFWVARRLCNQFWLHNSAGMLIFAQNFRL
jgi:hypothetical protein